MMGIVCELCGDIGVKNALICCFKCQVSMRHCYCLDVLPENLFSDNIMWACGDCQDMPQLHHGSRTTTNKFRSMNLSARREAFSGAGRRKRLAEARQASLLRTSELEIPVSIHGDSEAIALEKANAAAEKAAGLTSKKRKTKTPTRPSPLVLRDEEETEEEENREQGQDVALDDTQTTKTVDHVDPGLSKEADSRPFKRSRLSENPPSLSVDEDISEVKETSDHVASRLQEGFQMPSEDGIFELSKEIASAPALADFDIHSRDPNYSMIGGGIIQRSSDKQQVAEIEEQDVDLSLNYAGLQLCGISSTLFGLRNKCQTLTSELESCDKSRRRAFAEKEKYKKKCLRQEQDLAALNAEKQKVDEAVKAFEQTENELRGEMDALKLGLEEKNRRLEAENAQSATLIAQLKKDVADARAKAEEESMQLYDKALIHAMRAAAASSSEIPAITPELIAKWGSEPIYSDFCRLGHNLVPYKEDELNALAAEDKLLGKAVWEAPAIAEDDALHVG